MEGKSLSARRAWIEIPCTEFLTTWITVALRKESVDRNRKFLSTFWSLPVALRKESVDRNSWYSNKVESRAVALRKESVDRNMEFPYTIPYK